MRGTNCAFVLGVIDERIPHKRTVSSSAAGAAVHEVAEKPPRNPIIRLLKILGPGLITGASDDDPSGIGTYAVAGASLGYSMLWLALVTFPLMASVQFICAKIGMVCGEGLAGVLRRHYPRPLLYVAVGALFVANTINAGADIGAIAAALNLLLPIPIAWLIVPVAVAILVLQIFGSYRLISLIFKWLTLALFAYIASAFFAHPDPGEVLRGTLIPSISFDTTFLSTLVAILGTTISPYLFFWQASQEVEEEVESGRHHLWQRRGATNEELKHRAFDVNVGMALSNVVMYFIILATAATLWKAGQTDIQSAADAAVALEPLAGPWAKTLLALGLIGAGFLAVPILTGSAAYAVAEAARWNYGLNEHPGRAREFYAVIVIATLVGLAINFIGIDPIKALFWTAVINGLLAPPLMVLIMLVANNGGVMGHRKNGSALNVMGWAATAAMFVAAVCLIFTWTQSGS
jgi:NRAMP (natural resistance-associated macrophage protein)-like metal ion transporter